MIDSELFAEDNYYLNHGGETYKSNDGCCKAVVDGIIDILINLESAKGSNAGKAIIHDAISEIRNEYGGI